MVDCGDSSVSKGSQNANRAATPRPQDRCGTSGFRSPEEEELSASNENWRTSSRSLPSPSWSWQLFVPNSSPLSGDTWRSSAVATPNLTPWKPGLRNPLPAAGPQIVGPPERRGSPSTRPGIGKSHGRHGPGRLRAGLCEADRAAEKTPCGVLQAIYLWGRLLGGLSPAVRPVNCIGLSRRFKVRRGHRLRRLPPLRKTRRMR